MKKTLFNAYVLLGSNLQDPLQQVITALTDLSRINRTQVIKVSHFYKTKALGPNEQPDYINAVAALNTELTAHEILKELLDIEVQHGRSREVRWGARTLDLDLLLYVGQHVVNNRQLPNDI